MVNIKYKFVITFVMFGLLVLGSMYYINMIATITHEKTHKIIFKDYGVNSEIEIDYIMMTGTTTSINNSGRCNNENGCSMQHNLNEIVGYNAIVIMFNMWLIFINYVCFKLLFGEEK